MRRNIEPAVTAAALVSIALMILHVAQDEMHSSAGVGRVAWAILAAIVLVMLLATFGVFRRRAGYIVILVGGVLAVAMAAIHGMGPATMKLGLGFAGTIAALAVIGCATALLSAYALWRELRN